MAESFIGIIGSNEEKLTARLKALMTNAKVEAAGNEETLLRR